MINVYWYMFFSMSIINLFDLNFVWFFIFWYIVGSFSICKLYSHVSFMLLSLEMLSLVSLTVMIFLTMKLWMTHSFFFFFLCFIVGEAIVGLSLLVASSRVSCNELVSMAI